MREVAVLFARADSIYKTLPGVDVWDEVRDARKWPGGAPVVAHPPCRAWGSLRYFAKPVPGEKDLAIFAVEKVRRFGGVLEHPKASILWPTCCLPAPGVIDEFGGFTMPIDQDWFGHRAEKATRLYIVGISPRDLPAFPIKLEEPSHVVSASNRRRKSHPQWRPELRKAEREHTPPMLAAWLVDVAARCKGSP